jgi:hypothetical protein
MLSGIGSGSQVRSGQGQITGLRHFPYSGAVGLAGLGRVTAWVRRVLGSWVIRVKLG